MGGAKTMTVGRRAFLAGAAAAAGLLSACAAAADTGPALVDLQVVDRATGEPLPVWRRHGRAYVAGEPGARYALRLTNRTPGRVLLVLSVDGVNVLSGATAGYDQRGYVLEGYGSYDVDGWRKSQSEVAAFTFAGLSQSYAARTGRPGDVGVIGMAAFTERPPSVPVYAAPPVSLAERRRTRPSPSGDGPAPPLLPIPPIRHPIAPAPAPPMATPAPPSPPASSARSWGGASPEAFDAARPQEKLGTAHGEREWSYASLTTFVRATPYPQSVRRIEYDTYAHLAERGVIPRAPWTEHRPRPFPLEPQRAGFVPDPPEGPEAP